MLVGDRLGSAILLSHATGRTGGKALRFTLCRWRWICVGLLAVNGPLHAQGAGFQVLELNFSGLAQRTVVLFERPGAPEQLLIPASELPVDQLRDNALAQVPRQPLPACPDCIPIDALGAFTVDLDTSSGQLRFDPALLPQRSLRLGRSTTAPRPQNRPGLLLDWGLRGASRRAEGGDRVNTGSGDVEAIAGLGPLGVLRNSGVYIDDVGWIRGSSALSFYSIPLRTQLTLGDGVLNTGSLGSARRYAGINIRRRFDTQPDRVFTPAYNLSTVSSLPGTIDLFIDGERRRRQRVDAGTATFEDIRGSNGSNVTVRFTDELGTIQEVSTTLLGISSMLRAGALDYDLGFGAQRIGENTYGDPAGGVSMRLGVTNWLTMAVFGEGVENQYNVGGGLTLALPFAIIRADGARNIYPEDVDEPIDREEGIAATWSINNRGLRSLGGFNFGYAGRYVDNYRRLGTDDAPGEFQRLFAGWRYRRFAFSTSASRIDDQDAVSGSVSVGLASFALSVGGTAIRDGDATVFAALTWIPRSVPTLSAVSVSRAQNDVFASNGLAATFVDTQRRTTAQFSASRVEDTSGQQDPQVFGRARVGTRWRPVAASYDYRREPDIDQHSLRVQGGLGFAGLRPHPVPPLGPEDGYLVVETGVPGARVQYGGFNVPTDGRGRAVITPRGFFPAAFSIDPQSLPAGYAVQNSVQGVAVVPGGRGRAEIDLQAPGLLLTIRGGTAGETVIWNGEAHTLYDIGAYIEQSRAGVNQLEWRGTEYQIELPRIGTDIPEFEFDPGTGSVRRLP